MSTEIKITVSADLTEADNAVLRLLLADALGEFEDRRGGDHPLNYITARYPDLRDRLLVAKVREVRHRSALARHIRRALHTLTLQSLPPGGPEDR